MKKTTITYYCDVCKKRVNEEEIEKLNPGLRLPHHLKFEDDGRPQFYTNLSVNEICKECAAVITGAVDGLYRDEPQED